MKDIGKACVRLSRLHVLYREREFDPSSIEEELDRVCREVWGYTIDDIDEDALPSKVAAKLNELKEDGDAYGAHLYAMKNGYSLLMHGEGFAVVDNWLHFALMIAAETNGLLTSEHIASARLKNDAEDFVAKKGAGVLTG